MLFSVFNGQNRMYKSCRRLETCFFKNMFSKSELTAQWLRERWTPNLLPQIMTHPLEASLRDLRLPPHHRLLIGCAVIKMCSTDGGIKHIYSMFFPSCHSEKMSRARTASAAPCQVMLRDSMAGGMFMPLLDVKLERRAAFKILNQNEKCSNTGCTVSRFYLVLTE